MIATDDSDEQEERDDDGFFLGEIGNAAGKPWKEEIDVYGTKNLVQARQRSRHDSYQWVNLHAFFQANQA